MDNIYDIFHQRQLFLFTSVIYYRTENMGFKMKWNEKPLHLMITINI